MIVQCDQCGAERSDSSAVCPKCGKVFFSPDDLLNRSAADRKYEGISAEPPNGAGYTGGRSAHIPKSKASAGVVLSVIAGVICLLGLIGWVGFKAWMAGGGGDIAFRQYNLLGNDAASAHDYATADNDYGQMIALRPHVADGYLLRGIDENKEGRFTLAIADFTSGLATSPQPVVQGSMLFNRAWAEATSGRTTIAINDYKMANAEYAKETDPCCTSDLPREMMEASVNLSLLYYKVKDYRNTIKTTNSLISQGRGDYRMYAIRGESETALGQTTPATMDCVAAIRQSPDDKFTLRDVMKVVDQAKQYKVGVAAFTEDTRDSPQSTIAWGGLGWLQFESGHYPQAVVSDNRAIALDSSPQNVWVKFNLALTYAVSGQSDQAHAAYADALTLASPRDIHGGLSDIQGALQTHPSSKSLQAALAQVQAAG